MRVGEQETGTRTCLYYDLGLIEYAKALGLQQEFVRRRINGECGDVLLVLQHSPVYTIGKSGDSKNILVPAEVLRSEGIAVCYVDRGGDITYHGPGQIVGYPIIHLKDNGLDVHRYVWCLEELMIKVLADFGIRGERNSTLPSYRGVWVKNEKIGSIGIRVTRGVTMHGFALNVNTNLRHFAYIYPCGIRDKTVTSISKLLGSEINVDKVQDKILRHFAEILEMEVTPGNLINA